jgi:molybdopterin synthase sulfur carrier subunit
MSAPAEITLRYFAWVREKTGRAEEHLSLPAGILTVSDLLAWLGTRGPEFADAFAKPAIIRTAIDRRHVKAETPIAGAKEIAFFPPVTGG